MIDIIYSLWLASAGVRMKKFCSVSSLKNAFLLLPRLR